MQELVVVCHHCEKHVYDDLLVSEPLVNCPQCQKPRPITGYKKEMMVTNIPKRMRRMFSDYQTAKLLNYGTGDPSKFAKGSFVLPSYLFRIFFVSFSYLFRTYILRTYFVPISYLFRIFFVPTSYLYLFLAFVPMSYLFRIYFVSISYLFRIYFVSISYLYLFGNFVSIIYIYIFR